MQATATQTNNLDSLLSSLSADQKRTLLEALLEKERAEAKDPANRERMMNTLGQEVTDLEREVKSHLAEYERCKGAEKDRKAAFDAEVERLKAELQEDLAALRETSKAAQEKHLSAFEKLKRKRARLLAVVGPGGLRKD